MCIVINHWHCFIKHCINLTGLSWQSDKKINLKLPSSTEHPLMLEDTLEKVFASLGDMNWLQQVTASRPEWIFLRIESVIPVFLTSIWRFGCKLKHFPPLLIPVLNADSHFMITKSNSIQLGFFTVFFRMLLNGDVNLFLLTVGSFSQLLLVSSLKRTSSPPVPCQPPDERHSLKTCPVFLSI